VAFYHFLNEVKPDTRSLHRIIGRRSNPVKPPEDISYITGFNSWPGVTYSYFHKGMDIYPFVMMFVNYGNTFRQILAFDE
jgi:hypothetical protein